MHFIFLLLFVSEASNITLPHNNNAPGGSKKVPAAALERKNYQK